ncbi:MAG: hypothetical protein LBT27_06295 [Prevotellaceae bacterium]|jgi:hypothetical protein|nr:hypothetical protein [Prevotellaceae bacterium]
MIKRIKYIVFLCCLLTYANTFAQEVKGFELSIDKDTILIGDHITLSVKYKFNPRLIASFPELKDTIVPGVELVRELQIDTIRIENTISEYVKKYIITSFDSGHYFIMFPIIVEKPDDIENPDTLVSNVVQFHVNTIPVDTLTYTMFDIKEQVRYPIMLDEVLLWVFIIVAAIAIIILGIILYRRWKNKQPLFGKAKPKIPPHVLAFKELSLLKTEKLWQQGKVKLYYTRITDIIRKYIEDSFAIAAMEKTSDEILNEIKKNKIDKLYSFDKLREMFYTSDLVKFAKYQSTPDENETSFNTAYEFVTNTQPQQETETEQTAELQIVAEKNKEENTNE